MKCDSIIKIVLFIVFAFLLYGSLRKGNMSTDQKDGEIVIVQRVDDTQNLTILPDGSVVNSNVGAAGTSDDTIVPADSSGNLASAQTDAFNNLSPTKRYRVYLTESGEQIQNKLNIINKELVTLNSLADTLSSKMQEQNDVRDGGNCDNVYQTFVCQSPNVLNYDITGSATDLVNADIEYCKASCDDNKSCMGYNVIDGICSTYNNISSVNVTCDASSRRPGEVKTCAKNVNAGVDLIDYKKVKGIPMQPDDKTIYDHQTIDIDGNPVTIDKLKSQGARDDDGNVLPLFSANGAKIRPLTLDECIMTANRNGWNNVTHRRNPPKSKKNYEFYKDTCYYTNDEAGASDWLTNNPDGTTKHNNYDTVFINNVNTDNLIQNTDDSSVKKMF